MVSLAETGGQSGDGRVRVWDPDHIDYIRLCLAGARAWNVAGCTLDLSLRLLGGPKKSKGTGKGKGKGKKKGSKVRGLHSTNWACFVR